MQSHEETPLPSPRPAMGASRRDGRAVAATAFAGAGLAVQARINGELAVGMGSPFAAATVNFVVGLAIVTTVLVVRRVPVPPRTRLASTRWWHWTGGFCATVFVVAVASQAPRLGVSVVAVAVAAGMALAGLLADHAGLASTGRRPVSPARIAVAAIAVGAVAVAGGRGFSVAGGWPGAVFVVAGGFAIGCQHPINNRLSSGLDSGEFAAAASFAVGSVAIGIVTAARLPTHSWPADPSLYLGGAFAAAYVLVAIRSVGRIGALRLSLATTTGQLLGAAIVDVAAPIHGQHLTVGTAAGVLVAVAAVALSARTAREPLR